MAQGQPCGFCVMLWRFPLFFQMSFSWLALGSCSTTMVARKFFLCGLMKEDILGILSLWIHANGSFFLAGNHMNSWSSAICLSYFSFCLICFLSVLFGCFLKTAVTVYLGQDWSSPCRSGWPHAHRDPPASVYFMQRLKVYSTMPSLNYVNLTSGFWGVQMSCTCSICSPWWWLSFDLHTQKRSETPGDIPHHPLNLFLYTQRP